MEKRDGERKEEKEMSDGLGSGQANVCVSPTVDQSAVLGLPQPKAFILQRNFPQIPICA